MCKGVTKEIQTLGNSPLCNLTQLVRNLRNCQTLEEQCFENGERYSDIYNRFFFQGLKATCITFK